MKKLLLAVTVLLLFAGTAKAQHQVAFSWTASTTTTVAGYNVYRFVGACPSPPSLPAFTKLASTTTALTYTDATVTAGSTYCYTVTATTASAESGIGGVIQATIPTVTAVVVPNPPAAFTSPSVQ